MTLLIKKPLDTGSIVSFRLVTGEIIITKLVSQTDQTVVINKPVIANAIQQEGNFGIYFTPFCMTIDEDEDITLPVSSLLFKPLAARDDLRATYIKMMTGLEIPTGAI